MSHVPSPAETESLADQLFQYGLLTSDQRATAVRLSALNADFALAFQEAAFAEGADREARLAQLVPVAPSPASPTAGGYAPAAVYTGAGASPAYTDAYRVASSLGFFGAAAKGIGLLLLLAFVLAGFAAASELSGGNEDQQFLFVAAGAMSGGVVGLPFFLLGVLVSAHGQLLRATLDTASHTARLVALAERLAPSTP